MLANVVGPAYEETSPDITQLLIREQNPFYLRYKTNSTLYSKPGLELSSIVEYTTCVAREGEVSSATVLGRAGRSISLFSHPELFRYSPHKEAMRWTGFKKR